VTNCLLLTRVEHCAEVCGFDGCVRPAAWKLTYQRHVYYVCDQHLNAGEQAARTQHGTQLKGGTDAGKGG